MTRLAGIIAVLILTSVSVLAGETQPPREIVLPANLSPESRACIGCHRTQTPGIVHDWSLSRHARVTPADALGKPEPERRMSALKPPEKTARVVVGCYECHGQRTGEHRDSFEHFGRKVNVVVSPSDCATCHPVEEGQFRDSKKGWALDILAENPLYSLLVDTVTATREVKEGRLNTLQPAPETKWETCLGCHGTVVEAKGTQTVQTAMGPLTFPKLTNWPNQGVGRHNPDGSRGSCASCHSRHGFQISEARMPFTCGQCHLEPDVPGWNVYKESKHGNIFESRESSWDYDAVPWRPGRDFQAPTCSGCHNSALAGPDGRVVTERTHDFGARLWVRCFGLIYSHPEPVSGQTWKVRNAASQPLPTTFAGEPASEEKFLIGRKEQASRRARMERVCRNCHSSPWAAGHFEKFDATCRETDRMVLAATGLMQSIWDIGAADPANPFDEDSERLWVRQWLFYANSVRYASAMSGAPDYAAFKNGWWNLSEVLAKLSKEAQVKGAKPAAAKEKVKAKGK